MLAAVAYRAQSCTAYVSLVARSVWQRPQKPTTWAFEGATGPLNADCCSPSPRAQYIIMARWAVLLASAAHPPE